jgi:hypothetical protein
MFFCEEVYLCFVVWKSLISMSMGPLTRKSLLCVVTRVLSVVWCAMLQLV